MEVHHSHHLTHKKKWTEYLLESFMLFLAVFLGFLVENFREHKVEADRTRKHMRTMVENLNYDTTRYGRNVRVNINVMYALDSFRHEVSEAIEGRVNPNRLYYFFIRVGRSLFQGVPYVNEAAISQLKSSGLIRLIKNDSLVSEIGDYYTRRLNSLEGLKTMLFTKRDVLNETYKQIFSARGFDEMFNKEAVWSLNSSAANEQYQREILTRDPALKLLSTDRDKLEKLYSDLADMEWILGLYNSVIRYNHQGADSLRIHINKAYHFD